MQKILFLLAVITLAGCSTPSQDAPAPGSATSNGGFQKLADEYIAGYLAWRPLTGTTLGLHQYDGKITDFSKPSLDAELARLKSFAQRMESLDSSKLTPHDFYDYRILRNAINREIFGFEQMQIYARN